MPGAFPPVAVAASDATEFFTNLLTGARTGDPLSLVVVGIVVLIILRFTAARWFFVLAKQTFIFGGLAYGWYLLTTSPTVVDRAGEGVAQGAQYAGLVLVGGLYLIMLYIFFLKDARHKEAKAKKARAEKGVSVSSTTTRVGAGPLAGQGLPVTQTTQEAEVRPAKSAAASSSDGEQQGKLEEVLRKMNVLGTSRDQNIMTVFLLILVAEFGVFTSKTIAAPNATVGMFLFAAFLVGAIVFVKTSYKNYWTGVRHFVIATVFAVGLSVVMLVYWQSTYCDTSVLVANATADCAGDPNAAVTWAVALNPEFYFRSDGLIAAITGVAFSTLLTKGGGG